MWKLRSSCHADKEGILLVSGDSLGEKLFRGLLQDRAWELGVLCPMKGGKCTCSLGSTY